MPFTDHLSSVSGRNSRASNVSGVTSSIRSGPPAPTRSNDALTSAGVLSMLKTGTDTGDIGAPSYNRARLPNAPWPAHRQKGHHSRPSVPSDLPLHANSAHHYRTAAGLHHQYAPSQASRTSDSASFARRGSFTSMQSMPPSLPPVSTARPSRQMPAPTLERSALDNRSYSLTSAPDAQLPRHRSVTSLKSAGHEPRHGLRLHPSNVRLMSENRPPYVYPTRLKRPGYRSPSPTLSDLSAQGQVMPPLSRNAYPPRRHRGPPATTQRPPPSQSYHSHDGHNYVPNGQYLNICPPPRTMSISPVSDYESATFTHRPGPVRSDPGLAMAPVSHGQQPTLPTRGQYAPVPLGTPRPAYVQYAMQHPSNRPVRRRAPPQVNLTPMAHSMFHNAARMARHLPQRTETPLTELGLPSSDPPSSGTAPTSSSPPTPKDQSTIQVAVNPLFIDPALTDLPDSSSDLVMPARYFEYADGLEKGIDEPELEVHHPSVPPSGFVQRVKAMLESRAAVEAAANRHVERDGVADVFAQHPTPVNDEASTHAELSELHELAATQTPRFTVIEEFEAPVELPASPVRVAELSGTPAQAKVPQRITRELVKTELAIGSSSVEDSTSAVTTTEHSDINAVVELQTEPSEQISSSHSTKSSKLSAPASSDTPSTRRHNSTSGSAVTTIPEAISGMEYALRFSVPFDMTLNSNETQSKDPFILDADTITLQHQHSKDRPSQAPKTDDSKLPDPVSPPVIDEAPISPLRSDDDVCRDSAVSPLQIQTISIDATLRVETTTHEGSVVSDESPNKETSADITLPPTPRTPRTYSKSVQLPQSNTFTRSTPSSNRYSLPPDLGTVTETSMTTPTDMVTDIAVRFSLPSSTVTVSKPQIVTIPPSSSPDKPEPPPCLSKTTGLQPESARRNSVTFADQIAPLDVKKPLCNRNHYADESAGPKAISIIRRPLTFNDSIEPNRASREGTADSWYPPVGGLHSRLESTRLPRLNEESVEDISIDEHHKHGHSPSESHQLVLPARIAAVKAMQERRLQESAEKAKARRAARHHNRPLAELRDLPSLNFSRMDLVDKLNEALEIRPARSMEIVRRHECTEIYCPSPQRPQSTEPLRERYMSFFSKPEEFTGPLDDQESEEPTTADSNPESEAQESTRPEGPDEPEGSRPLSPEDFLNVANQVNRLSIPSVSGLSARLTSLLPALQNLHLDNVLTIEDNQDEIKNAVEDMQHLGEGKRPDTMLSNRTSAGFRTLAERAEAIVQHGTHDSMVPTRRLLLLDKELPPLPESASADKVSALTSTDGKQSYLAGSVSAPSNLGKEPTRPSPVLVRQKSPSSEEEVQQLLPPEMNPITRSKRSLIMSSASRPWNQDENYPWASTSVPVDLTIPSKAHTHDSVVSELAHTAKSLEITTSSERTNSTTIGIDIGSIITTNNLNRCASITTEQATGITTQHLRKHSKRSIIGSISKRIGLATHSRTNTHHDDAHGSGPSPTHRTAAAADDVASSLAYKPGDRYPSTSLTPPVPLHMDDVRSFFSDTSSERQRRQQHQRRGTVSASFCKRLTRVRAPRPKAVRLDPNTLRSMGTGESFVDRDTTYDAGSLNAQARRAGSSAHTLEGTGMAMTMGKAEFHLKKFGDKVRQLIARGGELIRSLSKRTGAQTQVPTQVMSVREEGVSESVYSGV